MENREGKKYRVIRGDNDFKVGETLVLTRDDGDSVPQFRSLDTGKTALMGLRYLEEIKGGNKMKLKVGKKAVVIGLEKTRARFNLAHSMKVGNIVTIISIQDDRIRASDSNGITKTYDASELARIKPSKQRLEGQVSGGKYVLTDDDLPLKKGDLVELILTQSDGLPRVKRLKDSKTLFVHFSNLVRVSDEADEVTESAKPKFQKGDIVKIIGNGNSSRNKVGDIGVITTEVREGDSFQVEVPNRLGSNGNWTRHQDAEPTGLKGELKK